MDEHGLPIVGAGVDYTKVPALEHKNTLVYLNKFIIHTTQFLNRFSTVCEERLADLSRRIQKLDISLNILEAKLSSIPDLEGVTHSSQYEPPAAVATAGASSASGSSSAKNAQPSSSGAPPPTTQAAPPPSGSGEPMPPPPPEEEEEAKPSKGRKVKDDPRYQKYFKMKRMGVNPLQIAMEMKRHGLNPDMIDNEDAELEDGEPGGGGVDASYGGGGGDSSNSSSESSADSDDSFDTD